MIPSHRAPDHVSCLQFGSTRERVYCFWPVRSIKRIFPEYWTPAGQRGQQYPHLALGSRTRTLTSGVRTTFSHMATPLVLYPGFLDKTNFPRILTRGSGTHRTLLQYPHGPVPEHYLALLVCTAAGGTRHSSLVPIYPLGLDKTNFPRIPENIFILSSGRN